MYIGLVKTPIDFHWRWSNPPSDFLVPRWIHITEKRSRTRISFNFPSCARVRQWLRSLPDRWLMMVDNYVIMGH